MPALVASDGVRLHYEVDDFTDPWRESATLVLLHAAMSNLRRFYAWVPLLARDFRVVRLDTRGHGRSEPPAPDTALTIDRLALDVVELLDHLGCQRAHVSGSSAGGYVAQQLAFGYPDRVARLALFSSTPGLKHSTAHLDAWVRMIRDKGVGGLIEETLRDRVDPAQVGAGFTRWMIDEAQAMDREFTCRFLAVMAGLDLSSRLHEIRATTLVVVPGADAVGTPAGYELLRRIPNARFIVYDGLAHNITNAVPERCAADLKAFLLEDRPA
ncbi:MAG TPA: alpha/beta hydrolase [Methylomirabilota bacterium]|jgi:pimeloyl-ACP methyl ester carboxylesterase|nr:alpha/beta hydrolase [Methylomirabilota bacterium]